MKWVMIIYFFTYGPGGSWQPVEKQYWLHFETKSECIENQKFFNALPKPGSLMARCKEL